MLGKTLSELETAFKKLNEELFNNELPDVCITIQHEPKKKNKNYTTLGWFSMLHVWKDEEDNEMLEINITSACLNQDYIDVIGTLIHEMVHLYCHTNNIEDCSGKKHNTNFKEECDKIGLICEKEKSVGWGMTSVGLDLRDKIVDLDLDEESFLRGCTEVVIEKPLKDPKPPKPKPVYVCPGCQEKIKSKKTDLAIMCVKCSQQFELTFEEK